MSVITERINQVGRPVFYVEVVVNEEGYKLLASLWDNLWDKKKKAYFVILNYWHQIHDPHENPKRVTTLAEVVMCAVALQKVKAIETNAGEGVLFKVRRCDLEGYEGWDAIDYE
jgi:hypothetical protein